MRKVRKRLFAELSVPDKDVEHVPSATPSGCKKSGRVFDPPRTRLRPQRSISDVSWTSRSHSALSPSEPSPDNVSVLRDSETTSASIFSPGSVPESTCKVPTCSGLELSIMLALQTHPAPLGSAFIKRFDDESAGVSSYLREIVVDWMTEIAFHFQLGLQTLAVSVRLLDELFSVDCISRSKLQLHAIACISIASKLEEDSDSAPEMKDLVIICDNITIEQLRLAERHVMESLQYCLVKQTSIGVITWLAQRATANAMNDQSAQPSSPVTDSTFFDSQKITEHVVNDAKFALLVGMLDSHVSAISVAAVAVAATRIALCVNGLNGDGVDEWAFIEGEENAVKRIIMAWLSIKPRKSKRIVFDSFSQSAAAFERTQDALCILCKQADDKFRPSCKMSTSPVTASPQPDLVVTKKRRVEANAGL